MLVYRDFEQHVQKRTFKNMQPVQPALSNMQRGVCTTQIMSDDEDEDPARLVRVGKNSQLLAWDATELPVVHGGSLLVGSDSETVGAGLRLVDEERMQAGCHKLVHGVHAMISLDGNRLLLHVFGKEMHTFVNERHFRIIDKSWQRYAPP